ncbi:MAG: hypothetical protein VX738_04210 [Planctomycetota bacterium]|nr:hypothetical protein [Planctomycetota bacterium]
MKNLHMRFVFWLMIIQIIICSTIVIGSFFKADSGDEVGFCASFLGMNVAALLNLLWAEKQMKANAAN